MMLGRSQLVALASGSLAIALSILAVGSFLTKRYSSPRQPGPVVTQMTTAGPSLRWNVDLGMSVLMDIQNTVNYQLNGTEAEVQWHALVPERGGVVHLGPDSRPFMLSAFHQLRCLDIIRVSYAHDAQMGHANPSSLTRHCLNYLRQMVLCRGDSRLERVVDPNGAHAVQIRDPQTCRDWRNLYAKVERNERNYQSMRGYTPQE